MMGLDNRIEDGREKQLILAAGVQSGGTTLVSWCFLQHPQVRGVLDMPHDEILLPSVEPGRIGWIKMTICSFRWREVAEYYTGLGYTVIPLLIVRDVRSAFASLSAHQHGRNGLTADYPPLEIRFLRFLEDWKLFRKNNWPVICYEELLDHPEKTLRTLCKGINLSWNDDVINWPKPEHEVLDREQTGNISFHRSRVGFGIMDALNAYNPLRELQISRSHLNWLESRFAEYLSHYGYGPCLDIKAVESQSVLEKPHSSRFAELLKLQNEISLLNEIIGEYRYKQIRISNHFLFGKMIRIWRKLVNASFDVLSEVKDERSTTEE